ncbi:MAG: Lpg1974 family pore-forming outer membrane protein [Leptospirales bacterium]|nr:Lpg1974 family pore-forming outer membrane protein [Leptospirales bacterium]
MKKFILLTLIAISISSIIPSAVYSIDITVGATTWCAWGNRNEDIMSDRHWTGSAWGNNSRRYGNNTNYSFDPSFLYGPALSIKFNNDFNLTFVYLYGKFEHQATYSDNATEIPHPMNAVYKFKRNDSDIALNYRLNDYLKVFAGIKYMKYDIKLTAENLATNAVSPCNSNHTGYGPGFGFSGTYPLTENIFLLGTLSGFYLFSSGEEFNDDLVYADTFNEKVGYNEYGINSTLSIAYYIAPAATVISLGGRFQYFKTDYDKKDRFYINSITNKMYGITLTATYTFSFL